jgi:transcriptional regulator with XRE-family HTH domain
MVQGRKPDLERRWQVVGFRSQGLTLREIGNRMGISRQAVFFMMKAVEKSVRRSVPCCQCGCQIVSAGALAHDAGNTFCINCLERNPQATFGHRLKTFRLAAGLTRMELAQASGTVPGSVKEYEEDRCFPRPGRREALARALDLTVERLGTGYPVLGRRPPGRPRKREALA